MTTRKPLRLWPGVVIVAIQWLARYALPLVWPDGLMYSVFAGIAGGLAVLIWWAFFSRAPQIERWSAIALLIGAQFLVFRFVHPSIATGMMGLMLPVFSIPILSLALVGWAVATRNLSTGFRWATMVATILIATFGWTLVRTNGINGNAGSDFAWRWAPTAEDKLLAQAKVTPAAFIPPAPVPTAAVAVKAPTEPALNLTPGPKAVWPGFRGPRRDGTIPGVRLDTDWAHTPPVALWHRAIGPGWSSFAVSGNLLYTQEQRGADELVSCYNLTTGAPVWSHADTARFWESNAGAGPRATPTLANGRVYTFGATGIVNALNASTGAVIWTRNASTDASVKIPGWGFASSPLVIDDEVIVAAEGKLVAYDIATGERRWLGPDGGSGYSSPQLFTIDGVEQIVLMSSHGALGVAPDGTQLWQHPMPHNAQIVQPALLSDGNLLVGDGEGHGSRRLAIAHGPTGWTVEERWTSIGLKPYFNDFVVHKGYAIGFDGSILSCIDLKDGKRVWKGGRYGNGQLVLLPDQDVLLVLSEEGELVLVSAASDQFKELARFPAIEGKTWNHPVLAGKTLLVRNGEQMAAFRLSRN